MKKRLTLLILFFIPLISIGQTNKLDTLIKKTNIQLRKADRILHFENQAEYQSDVDSLVINNKKIEDIALNLYHTELAMEKNVDYYVVGMDIPFLELKDLEKLEHQIRLYFSRDCELKSSEINQIVTLNFSSIEVKDEVYQKFKELILFRNKLHEELHKSNQCNLEAR